MGQRTSLNPYKPNNLALTLRHLGKFDEAEQILFDTLARSTKLLGYEHLLTIKVRNNYAAVLGLPSRAHVEQVLREATEASTQSLGATHPDSLAIKENLGRLLESQGRYADAELLYREVMAVWESLGSTNHLRWLNVISGLSSVLRTQGVYEETEKVQGQVFELSTKIFGPQHQFTSSAEKSLSCIRIARDSQVATSNFAEFTIGENGNDITENTE